MREPPITIALIDDAVPHRVNGARPIPLPTETASRSSWAATVPDSIIEPVSEPTEWCHPIVIVGKKNSSEKRLTVDLRKLNDQVRRPTHPMTIPRAAAFCHWNSQVLHHFGCSPRVLTDSTVGGLEASHHVHHTMGPVPILPQLPGPHFRWQRVQSSH